MSRRQKPNGLDQYGPDICARTAAGGRCQADPARRAERFFLEAEALSVDKIPDRSVIHLHPARRELGHEAAQCKILRYTPQQPPTVFADQYTGPMPAHLTRRHAACCA
jgi:hypothetical protein